eukprot:SAG22_NODE_2293_length_2748_cov_2.220838_1_plen_70_part_00
MGKTGINKKGLNPGISGRIKKKAKKGAKLKAAKQAAIERAENWAEKKGVHDAKKVMKRARKQKMKTLWQ